MTKIFNKIIIIGVVLAMLLPNAVMAFDGMSRSKKTYNRQHENKIEVFTENGESLFYGARNEPVNGVLFGITADSQMREELPQESMTLLYHELGVDTLDWSRAVMEMAKEDGIAIEFAVNCSNEGDDIRNIDALEPKLYELSEFLKQYPTIPIYLRFGAEFDIWPNKATPEEFIYAYKKASNIFRENENVAMVWSATTGSTWGYNVHDFYPGDEYVDWIGISTYSIKYFLGQKEWNSDQEMIFQTGIYANPVLLIAEFVDTYGDRKPIMLAESGATHYVYSPEGWEEDVTAWGENKIKEIYYNIPMMYPQVKLIAHFDNYVGNEINDYRLNSNDKMWSTYVEAINNSEKIIKNSGINNSDFYYKKIVNNTEVSSTLPVYTYAHILGGETQEVHYYIDDVWVGMSNEIPFKQNLDLSNIEDGVHILKTVATNSVGEKIQTESNIVLKNNI